MVAIGVGMVFAGYAVTMWGYCLIRGYNVPFTSMFRLSGGWGGITEQPPSKGHKLGTITSPGVQAGP